MTQPAYGKLVSSTRDGRIERSNAEWIELLGDIATVFENNLTCISVAVLFFIPMNQY